MAYRYNLFFPCKEKGGCCFKGLSWGHKICCLDKGECEQQDLTKELDKCTGKWIYP